MSTRTEPHHLTREEGIGYLTALKELRAWHEGQLTYAEGIIADIHQEAIAEIDRLTAMQREATFGK